MNPLHEVKTLLEALYAKDSKHAHYQTLPEPLAQRLGMQFQINEEWRGDRTRYQVILAGIPAQTGLRILDVGANTGFFSLSLAHDRPAARITACESNPTHARIIRLLAEVGGYEHVVVTELPACLDNLADFAIHDCILHLNILHHAGHDFDADKVAVREAFRDYAVNYLAGLRGIGTQLVFQMGYHWGGDKTLPLVHRDDQAGKVAFTNGLLERAGWTVEGIAFARAPDTSTPISYERFTPDAIPTAASELQSWLTSRYGTRIWSEFYQRPIWFCRA